jgi:hypothetical protein
MHKRDYDLNAALFGAQTHHSSELIFVVNTTSYVALQLDIEGWGDDILELIAM